MEAKRGWVEGQGNALDPPFRICALSGRGKPPDNPELGGVPSSLSGWAAASVFDRSVVPTRTELDADGADAVQQVPRPPFLRLEQFGLIVSADVPIPPVLYPTPTTTRSNQIAYSPLTPNEAWARCISNESGGTTSGMHSVRGMYRL